MGMGVFELYYTYTHIYESHFCCLEQKQLLKSKYVFVTLSPFRYKNVQSFQSKKVIKLFKLHKVLFADGYCAVLLILFMSVTTNVNIVVYKRHRNFPKIKSLKLLENFLRTCKSDFEKPLHSNF